MSLPKENVTDEEQLYEDNIENTEMVYYKSENNLLRNQVQESSKKETINIQKDVAKLTNTKHEHLKCFIRLIVLISIILVVLGKLIYVKKCKT